MYVFFICSLQTTQNQNNVPSTREKSLLLYRMMLNFEKRFADDLEVHAQFADIVHYVYRYCNMQPFLCVGVCVCARSFQSYCKVM